MSEPTELPVSPTAGQRPRAKHDQIAHDLGIAIVGGRHQPGEMLPGEERYSAERGISRAAYREAVRILSAKGWSIAAPRAVRGSTSAIAGTSSTST